MKKVYTTQLRQQRELQGWSRAYVAEQVGVDVATVGRWERGERLPHPHHRQLLCALYVKSALDLGLLSEMANDGATMLEPQQDEELVVVASSLPAEDASSTAEESSEDGLVANKALTVMSQQNRQRMLRRMHTFWINGVLEQSLRGTGLIPLELKEQSNAVMDPWVLTLQQPEALPRSLSSCMRIGQIYDESDGELLILGEPGSGKTTLLLELARMLLERGIQHETHPIPVVFNLGSWAIKRQPFGDWLVEELCGKYQVPHQLAQTWIQLEQILPLLDGLDEVTSVARNACIESINIYRQEHGLQPVVVCSRSADYLMQDARLLLRRGVTIQPLSNSTIEEYFARVGDELVDLYRALLVDSTLLELATSPLFLNILALTYQNKAVDTLLELQSPEARRSEVFANYVARMLTHRKGHYTAEQTLHWLSWLAKKLVRQQETEFYIERIQPNWLSSLRAFRWYCRLLVGLLMGLLGGVTGLLADVSLYEVVHRQIFEILAHTHASNLQCADTLPLFDNVPEIMASLFSLPTVGIIYGTGFSLLGGVLEGLWARRSNPQSRLATMGIRRTSLGQRALILLVGLGCGSVFVLINVFWVPCPFTSEFYNQFAEELGYGLCGVLIGGLISLLAGELFGAKKYHVQPIEVLIRTHISSRRRVVFWLLGGIFGALSGVGTVLVMEVYLGFSSWYDYLLLSALIGGILGAMIGEGIGGLSRNVLEDRSQVRPNEGIRKSIRNGLNIGCLVSLALCGFTLGLILWLVPVHVPDGLLWCTTLSIIVFVTIALLNGGYAWLQHFVLRFILWFQGYIPWNYARFLDESATRLLLRKVGGGYIFIHRLLLEYFASHATEPEGKYPWSKARRFQIKRGLAERNIYPRRSS